LLVGFASSFGIHENGIVCVYWLRNGPQPCYTAIVRKVKETCLPAGHRGEDRQPLDEAFRAGIELFNSRKYFECHEALEAIWLRTAGEEKVFLHGLIQIAAAFHHHTRRNPTGARSLLEKGWKKLERFGDARREIDLAGLRRQLQPWRDFLSREKAEEPARLAPPPLPRIGVSRDPYLAGPRG
jgi:uncharacterized protein